MKIVALKERGEPVVISLPLSQVIYFAHFNSEVFVFGPVWGSFSENRFSENQDSVKICCLENPLGKESECLAILILYEEIVCPE